MEKWIITWKDKKSEFPDNVAFYLKADNTLSQENKKMLENIESKSEFAFIVNQKQYDDMMDRLFAFLDNAISEFKELRELEFSNLNKVLVSDFIETHKCQQK